MPGRILCEKGLWRWHGGKVVLTSGAFTTTGCCSSTQQPIRHGGVTRLFCFASASSSSRAFACLCLLCAMPLCLCAFASPSPLFLSRFCLLSPFTLWLCYDTAVTPHTDTLVSSRLALALALARDAAPYPSLAISRPTWGAPVGQGRASFIRGARVASRSPADLPQIAMLTSISSTKPK